jgi:hypothetical protein
VGRGGILGFFIRNERGDALDPNAVEVRGDNSGIKNVNSDPGQYYIQIISAEVDWTIRVEDCGNRPEDSGNHRVRRVDPRERVIPHTNVRGELVNTGGPAILAPAIGLLLISGAAVGLLVGRR